MALTPGFKKFIGLIVVIGVVSGGLYFYKTMPRKTQSIEHVSDAQSAPIEFPQPIDSPISQAKNLSTIVDSVVEPIHNSPPIDVSANRGIANLLNQGKK